MLEAVEVAKAAGGGPVQLFWTRDDDLRDGVFHPPSRHRLGARLDRGTIAAWRHRVVAPSIERQWRIIRSGESVAIPRADSSGAWNLPYVVADFQVE